MVYVDTRTKPTVLLAKSSRRVSRRGNLPLALSPPPSLTSATKRPVRPAMEFSINDRRLCRKQTDSTLLCSALLYPSRSLSYHPPTANPCPPRNTSTSHPSSPLKLPLASTPKPTTHTNPLISRRNSSIPSRPSNLNTPPSKTRSTHPLPQHPRSRSRRRHPSISLLFPASPSNFSLLLTFLRPKTLIVRSCSAAVIPSQFLIRAIVPSELTTTGPRTAIEILLLLLLLLPASSCGCVCGCREEGSGRARRGCECFDSGSGPGFESGCVGWF